MLKSVLRLQALSTGKRMPSNFSVHTGVQITWSSCSFTQSEKQFHMTHSTLMNTLSFLSGVCRCRHKTTVSINCRIFSSSLGELLASVVRAGRCSNVNWPADAAFNDNLDAFVRQQITARWSNFEHCIALSCVRFLWFLRIERPVTHNPRQLRLKSTVSDAKLGRNTIRTKETKKEKKVHKSWVITWFLHTCWHKCTMHLRQHFSALFCVSLSPYRPTNSVKALKAGVIRGKRHEAWS